MLLAALLDAGADAEFVRQGLRGLGVEGLALEVSNTERHSLAAARVRAVAPSDQATRTWAQVSEMVDGAGLPERARARAGEAFSRLAAAEGRIHGIAPEEVHFHEVGAVDALAEVCGVGLALEALEVEHVFSSPLPVARGFAEGAHGRLPLPAPATLELLKGAPVYGVEGGVELVTPTGAALVAALAESYGPVPAMRIEAVGYGAGSRDLAELPNLVRAVLGERLAGEGAAEEWGPSPGGTMVSLVEANLDDLSPELVPDAADECFAAGALDVWATPAQMKKGRPGIVLSALARPAAERAVVEAMMRGTSTLGVRIGRLERWELARETRTVRVGGQPVRVKVGQLDGEAVSVAPEHDDCAELARRTGQPVKAVWAAALAATQEGDRRA